MTDVTTKKQLVLPEELPEALLADAQLRPGIKAELWASERARLLQRIARVPDPQIRLDALVALQQKLRESAPRSLTYSERLIAQEKLRAKRELLGF